MENSTFQVGLQGWIESSHFWSSGLLQSGTSSMVDYLSARLRNSDPGTKHPLRLFLSLRPSGVPELLEWSLYVCNTYNNPFPTGYDLELSLEVATLQDALISCVKKLTPGSRWTAREIADMRQSICPTLATGSLLDLLHTCYRFLLSFEEKSSRAGQQEQPSLAV